MGNFRLFSDGIPRISDGSLSSYVHTVNILPLPPPTYTLRRSTSFLYRGITLLSVFLSCDLRQIFIIGLHSCCEPSLAEILNFWSTSKINPQLWYRIRYHGAIQYDYHESGSAVIVLLQIYWMLINYSNFLYHR